MKLKLYSALVALFLFPSLALANVPVYPKSEIKHSPKAPASLLYMYQGKLNTHGYKTRSEVRKACKTFDVHSDFGCSAWNSDRSECTIVFLLGKPHVYWHEIAHCNGGSFHP